MQVLGDQGVTGKTLVERIFREVRGFRIYDGPSEVHRWSLAKRILRDWRIGRALVSTPSEWLNRVDSGRSAYA